MNEVPTIRLAHMSEAEKRAYVIADNKLAENAGWDAACLRSNFRSSAEIDLEFDLTITGFETAEIDLPVDETEAREPGAPDDEVLAADRRCRRHPPGDLWHARTAPPAVRRCHAARAMPGCSTANGRRWFHRSAL